MKFVNLLFLFQTRWILLYCLEQNYWYTYLDELLKDSCDPIRTFNARDQ